MQQQAPKRRRRNPQAKGTPADVWFTTAGVLQTLARPSYAAARPPAVPEPFSTDVISIEQFRHGCQACWEDLDAQLLEAGEQLQTQQGEDMLLDASDLQVPLLRRHQHGALTAMQAERRPAALPADAAESLAEGGGPSAGVAATAAASRTRAGTLISAQNPGNLDQARGFGEPSTSGRHALQQQQHQQQQQQQMVPAAAAQLLHSFKEAAKVGTKPAKLPQPMPPVDADAARTSTAGVTAAALTAAAAAAAEAAAGGTTEKLPPDEVLITVAVFDGVQLNSVDKPSVVLELQLLGSQPLTALRDALNCPTDALLSSVEGTGVPGAYMCLEGAFYKDDRVPNAGDPSAAIRAFCARRGIIRPPALHRRTGAPKSATASATATAVGSADATASAADAVPVASMASTTWADVKLRVSSLPLDVLCHQGCCEHALMVTDVRQCHPSDAQRVSAYPRVLWRAAEGVSRKRTCQVCGRQGDRLVTECKEAPGDPCLVCEACCALLVAGAAQQGQQGQQGQQPVVFRYGGATA